MVSWVLPARFFGSIVFVDNQRQKLDSMYITAMSGCRRSVETKETGKRTKHRETNTKKTTDGIAHLTESLEYMACMIQALSYL